jgi:SAM-dependent methyltransferase
VKFDSYANDYEKQLNESLRASGESSEYFARHKAVWLRRNAPAEAMGRILDYGCGIGLATRHLAEFFPASVVHGFDLSENSLERAARRCDEALVDRKAKVVFFSDPGRLEGDHTLILLANVLHHVPPPERDKLLRGVARLLAPGGRLLVWEHNPLNPLTRRVVASLPFDDDAILLPLGETSSRLRGVGLSLERRDYVFFFPRFLKGLRFLEPWMRRLPLGAQYAVLAKRDL